MADASLAEASARLLAGELPAHDDALALIDQTSGAERRLSFAWLHAHASLLAASLQTVAPPRSLVALLSPRCAEAVAAVLATWRVGAAYLPLDVHAPRARLAFLLADASPAAAFASAAAASLAPPPTPLLLVDGSTPRPAPPLGSARRLPAGCAYVLYTSGSTGTPKGVIGARRGLARRLEWMWARLPFGRGELCAQRTPPTFVDALCETLGPLGRRVPLLLLPHRAEVRPEAMGAALRRAAVSRLVLTPAALRLVLDAAVELPSLRCLALSGDALPASLGARACAAVGGGGVAPPHGAAGGGGGRVINLYGATEVAADATWHDVAAAAGAGVGRRLVCPLVCPLGQPIDGVRLVLLRVAAAEGGGGGGEEAEGWRWEEVAEGEVGEIVIGGECVCLGYLDRPELDAARFVRRGGEVWFRSGDLGEWDDAGALRFAGRMDHQLKVNGVRVEPREIEAAFDSFPSLLHVAVVPLDAADDASPVASSTPRLALCASLSSRAAPPLEPLVDETRALRSALHAAAAAWLPEGSRPCRYVVVGALPLLASGKVDRQAVRRAMPAMLAAVVGEVCGGAVGWDVPFVEAGGNSLLAVRACDRLRRRGWVLEAEALLRADGCVAKASEAMRREGGEEKAAEWQALSSWWQASASGRGSDGESIHAPPSQASGASSLRREASPPRAAGEQDDLSPLPSRPFPPCAAAFSPLSLGKCVDASPLVACFAAADRRRHLTAFVGSHAGRVVAVDVASGAVRWSVTLPDRLEASCALSLDGSIVVVGCYDHRLYALSASDGARLWSFEAQGAIKAAACFLPTSQARALPRTIALPLLHLPPPIPTAGLASSTPSLPSSSHLPSLQLGDIVACGCFGSSLFALRAHSGAPLWRRAAEGPLFATPAADTSRRQLYLADLRGCVHCVRYDDDGLSLAWQYTTTRRRPPHSGGEPIFSSPLVCAASGNLCFGCMDRRMHCVSPRGELLWTFDAGGPIFSAPARAMALRSPPPAARGEAAGLGQSAAEEAAGKAEALEERLYFTSQAGQVFCLLAADGTLRWHQPAEVHGHSSAAVDTAEGQGYSARDYAAHVVCVGGVDGTVHVFGCADGTPLASYRLPGAIFSSPALCASRIIVGSRDDQLYCLEVLDAAASHLTPREGGAVPVPLDPDEPQGASIMIFGSEFNMDGFKYEFVMKLNCIASRLQSMSE
ncbi:hypothetical protein AB1Y20_014771 [Prymnesium parvum]|uniref:AMP-dependent synthetase/ligase domain-containing protein n=1 Tax=Prymnesium parvum TaxID=97485 RepID=A0AB34IEG0_PRYPA